MGVRDRIADQLMLLSKYWGIVCEMNLGGVTGGYYDQYALDRISRAIEEYEQAKVAYLKKWSKK